MSGLAPNAAIVAALRTVADLLEQQPATSQQLDEVRPIATLAEAWGLEAKALARESKRAGIAVRIGRQLCARRSDVVALVDQLRSQKPEPEPRNGAATPDDAYASLVASTTKRRGKRAA